MRKSLIKAALVAVSLLFAAGFLLVPGRTVSADKDRDLSDGQTISVDFEQDKVWWFRMYFTKPAMVEVSSTGNCEILGSLFRESKENFVKDINTDTSEDNFILHAYLEANTIYYVRVQPRASYADVSANDVKVTMKDITDPAAVVTIDSSNFPDPVFRDYVDKNFDVRNDGVLSRDEVKAARTIELGNKGISSLKGIEYLTELETLKCYNNDLESLDLTKNTKLIFLNCSGNNQMTSLKIDNCTELVTLYLSNCPKVTKLELSACRKLLTIICGKSGLEKLDLTGLAVLEDVDCQKCNLSELTLKGCSRLIDLNCQDNYITAIDASDCKLLYKCDCSNNELTSLKLASNLHILDCWNNKLEKLDISGNSKLRILDCSSNGIGELDISDCPYLIYVYKEDLWSDTEKAYTTVLGTEDCLLKIDKPDTKIKTTDADVSEKVVEINGTNFPDAYFRKIVQISDTNHDGWLDKLEIAMTNQVIVEDPKVKSVEGIKYLSGLSEFYCMQNTLAELDLSANTSLEGIYLDVFDSNIEKINIKGLTNLRYLHCSFNDLSVLDISTNKNLVELYCQGNPLAKLDISNNRLLSKAYKEGEKEESSYKEISIVCYMDYSTGAVLKINKDTVIKDFTPTPTSKPTATPTATPTSKPTTAPAVSLKLDKKTATVTCGKTLKLNATLTGSNAAISWKSSDTKIATVSSSGKITTKMAGEVTITATAAGKSAKCVVTVLYKDVTNSKDFWYAPTNYLTAKGVVKGYDKQTKFKPANDCTRAQMVTFLYRLQGEPKTKSSTCKFKDVKKTDYFYKPVIWASEKGITTGVSKDKFDPQRVCTRAQTVTFLWRMADKPKPKTTKNPFPDVKKKDYFYTATLWASEKKILAGMPDGTFNPQGKCLRRQMVTFLYKYDKYVNGKG